MDPQRRGKCGDEEGRMKSEREEEGGEEEGEEQEKMKGVKEKDRRPAPNTR